MIVVSRRALTMYDSVDLETIPRDAAAVAGYVGGRFPTWDDVRRRWPNAHLLSIAVQADEDAMALDVEAGDASAAEAPGWILRQQARGVHRPIVYTSLSAAGLLLARCRMAEVPRSEFRLWTAHWTGRSHRCSHHCLASFSDRAGATQWTDHALGRNLDASSVFGPEFFPR